MNTEILMKELETCKDEDEMKRLYESGYGYEDHPFEIEAINAEEEWSLFQ